MTPHTSANLAFIGAERRTPVFNITDRQWELACELARRTGSKVVVGAVGSIDVIGWKDGNFDADTVIEYGRLIDKDIDVVSKDEIVVDGMGSFTYGEICNLYFGLCGAIDQIDFGNRATEFLRG